MKLYETTFSAAGHIPPLTLFLPLGFITGLLGINVGGIPLAESARGFLVICLVLLGIAVGTVLYFRWSKWF